MLRVSQNKGANSPADGVSQKAEQFPCLTKGGGGMGAKCSLGILPLSKHTATFRGHVTGISVCVCACVWSLNAVVTKAVGLPILFRHVLNRNT